MKIGLVYINPGGYNRYDGKLTAVLDKIDGLAVDITFISGAQSANDLPVPVYDNINNLVVVCPKEQAEAVQDREWYIRDKTVICFVEDAPDNLDEILDKLIKGRTVYRNRYIKTFGLEVLDIAQKIDNIPERKTQIKLYPSLLECDVVIRYPQNLPPAELDLITDAVVNRLGDAVYYVGGDNTCLAKVAHSLMLKHGKRLAVAESFTGGRVAAGIVEISGASKVLLEGLVSYSNISKIHRLDVDSNLLTKEGAVSHETAYQMAANLLTTSGADIVISTTGYADKADDGQSGLCFIAIGDKRGIHLYRHKFEGNRCQVIQSGVKAAYFKLIRELKKL